MRIPPIAILFILFLSFKAHAAIELRGTYGEWATAPTSFNSENTATYPGYPKTTAPMVMGGDLIYLPERSSLMIGVRYENFSSSNAASFVSDGATVNAKTKLSGTRVAGLIGFRADYGSTFIGLIGSVGITQNAEYDFTLTSTSTASDSLIGKVGTTYSAGIEAGFRSGHLEFGIEGGYLNFNVLSFTDQNTAAVSTNNDGTKTAMDLSGPYGRAFLGLLF